MFEWMACLLRAINSEPNWRAPVPQSRISRSPLAVVSSTQEVLPPKWFVSRPGVAIDPLVPQKRTLIDLLAIRGRDLAQDSATLDAAARACLAAHPAHAILTIFGWLLLAAEQPIAFEIGLTVVEVSAPRLLQRCAGFLQAGHAVLACLAAHARSAVSLVGCLSFRQIGAIRGCRDRCA